MFVHKLLHFTIALFPDRGRDISLANVDRSMRDYQWTMTINYRVSKTHSIYPKSFRSRRSASPLMIVIFPGSRIHICERGSIHAYAIYAYITRENIDSTASAACLLARLPARLSAYARRLPYRILTHIHVLRHATAHK